MTFLKNTFLRLLPPYHRPAVFTYSVIQMIVATIVMSIYFKFWEFTHQIFPIAFQMFDDTVAKRNRLKPYEMGKISASFVWTEKQLNQLNLYQTRLVILTTVAIFCVIFAMVCIISQFFTDDNDDRGYKQTYCMKWRTTSCTMAALFLLLIITLSVLLSIEVFVFDDRDKTLFLGLFNAAEKEEQFVTKLEHSLNCVSDDDIENIDNWECDNIINRSMMGVKWSYPLWIIYLSVQAISPLILIALNRPRFFGKSRRNSSEADEDQQVQETPIDQSSSARAGPSAARQKKPQNLSEREPMLRT